MKLSNAANAPDLFINQSYYPPPPSNLTHQDLGESGDGFGSFKIWKLLQIWYF